MNGGYGVNPGALAQTAKGINDAIGELNSLGVKGSGDTGRGFKNMSLTGMQVGHQGLESAFENFCDRWEWGVRTLVSDANAIASDLDLSAGAYYDAEHYASGALKDFTVDVTGNPRQTDEQTESKSWHDDTVGQYDQLLHPDYSAKSFEDAGTHMSKTWRTEGRDVVENTATGQAVKAAGYGDQLQKADDETFGTDTRAAGGK